MMIPTQVNLSLPTISLFLAVSLLVVLAVVGISNVRRPSKNSSSLNHRYQILETLDDGIILLDLDGRVLDINQKARQMTGLLGKVVTGYPVVNLIENWPNLEEKANSRERIRFNHTLLHGQASHSIQFIIEPLQAENGILVGNLVTMRDNSERQKVEQNLLAHRLLLDSVMNTSSALIYVKSLDGRYTMGNHQWAAQLNTTISSAIGKTDQELHSAETAIQLRANDLAVIKAGKPMDFEEIVEDPQGNRLIYLSTKFPLFDVSGKLYATAGISTNITERKEIESALQLQSFALNAAANAIVITNIQGSIEWVNPAFTKLTGYTAAEVIGANPRILKSNRTTPDQYAELWKTILDGKVWQGELINRRKDETEYIEEMTIAPMLGQDGHITHFIAVKQDITERRQAEEALIEAHQRLKVQFAEINALKEKLREQAIRDPLTGLFNRRYLQETLKRELARARRDRTPISIVMLDIDLFKQVNDSYGHAAGDLMLQDLGEMLRNITREGDVACRYGGEEFIAVMPGAPLAIGVERAELIRHEFEFLKVRIKNFKLHPTLSIGVAAYPDHADSMDELLSAADQALYLSKQNGRNQVQTFKG